MTLLNEKINQIEAFDIDAFNTYPFMNDYQRIATKSAIYPGQGTMLGISYCLHKLAGEAGEANEHFGKAQRDDGLFTLQLQNRGVGDGSHTSYLLTEKPMTPERREFLLKELGDCLWYISAIANELRYSLREVALMNLKKLFSRTQRDTLHGEGDNR